MKVFRIIPEFRILRLTFHRNKISLKFLNCADANRLFDLFSVYLKKIDHLNLKLLIFVGILQVLRFDFKKYRILEILNFHPCVNLIVNTNKNVDQLACKKAKPRGYNTSSCSTQLSIIVFPAHNCSNDNTCWHCNIC